MRVISLHILKWEEENSLFITSAYDLSFISILYRHFFKQTVNFGARTAVNRSKPGEIVSVHLPDAQAQCYVHINADKIAFAVLADDKYPDRIAKMILRKMSMDFNKDFEAKQFISMQKDNDVKWQKMDMYIKKFQDPKEVDKLEKLKGELEEVEKIVHKNMNDLLKREEDLDKLMQKSKDVSNLSLDFYKNAKKTNKRCCSLY